ncbi:MAG: hypothetical protein AB2690_17380 [Candidatus Thiodiazotropha endolucinida]
MVDFANTAIMLLILLKKRKEKSTDQTSAVALGKDLPMAEWRDSVADFANTAIK